MRSDTLIFILVALLILFGAFKLWEVGERNDLNKCKSKYGSSYVLGHSNTNSSIKWCVSPEGTMKTL